MRICIIDDDPICHFIAKKMIGKMFPQCELSHFYDGKKAIEFFEEKYRSDKTRVANLVNVILG